MFARMHIRDESCAEKVKFFDMQSALQHNFSTISLPDDKAASQSHNHLFDDVQVKHIYVGADFWEIHFRPRQNIAALLTKTNKHIEREKIQRQNRHNSKSNFNQSSYQKWCCF